MGKRAEEPEVKLSAKEKRQQKAREKAGAVAKKKKDVEVDEVAEVRPYLCGSELRVLIHSCAFG